MSAVRGANPAQVAAQVAAAGGEQAALGNTWVTVGKGPEKAPVPRLPLKARLRLLGQRLRTLQADGMATRRTLGQVAAMAGWLIDCAPEEFNRYKKKESDNMHAVTACGSMRYAEHGITAAVLTADTGTVTHSHIEHCGSVWACPVCAGQIQPYRRDEVRQAIEWARNRGYDVAMMTLTASHSRHDALLDIVDKFRSAWRGMQQDIVWRDVRASLAGMIRATEVTHSLQNGWHYHYHVLLLSRDASGIDETELRDLWLRKLVRAGLCDKKGTKGYESAQKHAFRFDVLRAGHVDKISNYVNKMANEVTLSTLKRGRGGRGVVHRSPFGILRDLTETDDAAAWNRDLHLWAEYVFATKRTAQLIWSRELKSEVGVKDVADEDIVEERQEDAAAILWGLTAEHWTALAHAVLFDDYYVAAQEADATKIQQWLDDRLPGLPRIVPAVKAAKLYIEQKKKDELRRAGHYPADELDEEEQEAMRVDYEQGRRTHYRVLAAHGDADASRRYDEMIDLDVPF